MRIRITGYGTRHGGSGYTKFEGMSCLPELLMEGFRALGHEVTVGPVDSTVDPRTWDAVFCVVHPVGWPGARYGMRWLAWSAWARELGVAVCEIVDDFNMCHVIPPESFTRRERIESRSRMANADHDFVMSRWADIARRVYLMRNGLDDMPIISCMFPWGKPELLEAELGLKIRWLVDPTSFLPTYGLEDVHKENKDREWIFAGIRPYKGWPPEDLRWPVQSYGPEKAGYQLGVLSEAQLIARYLNAWGLFSPGQGHTAEGSGWWRSRPFWAALTWSIWVGEPGEGFPISQWHGLNARVIETFSDDDLAEIAKQQRDAFLSKIWTKDDYLNSLVSVLEELTGFAGRVGK